MKIKSPDQTVKQYEIVLSFNVSLFFQVILSQNGGVCLFSLSRHKKKKNQSMKIFLFWLGFHPQN